MWRHLRPAGKETVRGSVEGGLGVLLPDAPGGGETETVRAMQEERARETEFQAEHRCGGEDAEDRAMTTGYCEDARQYRKAVDAGVRR
jgi:hypothetical protein